MVECFGNIYRNRKVLVTGHTGFKGSWLAFWLSRLGAKVTGYALTPQTHPSHFELLDLDMISIIGDIRDRVKIEEVVQQQQPEIIFHLAAQPLVRYSYINPRETFETNVMGTINIFEAARKIGCARAIVNVTSDKCYENKEWVWGYRENDPMGGYDPYSASKGCAELVTRSYQNSFFNIQEFQKNHTVLLASARAGNVIGGGDWAQDRLIPDIMEAVAQNKKALIRSPFSTRPWQHVLDPLSGYLVLGQKLLEAKSEYAEGWNFGPGDEGALTVEEIIQRAREQWGVIHWETPAATAKELHEAHWLKLDCSNAHMRLKWKSVWDTSQAVLRTIQWYRRYFEKNEVSTLQDIETYITDATAARMEWTT
ncbi:MAG: CDP-glucose 4,6-dehydratase [Candidatus Omnitrophica bacterium]|nr:CDP-glucose 4,6-dehydratase [Candidatus Omnitrophota bacterium]